MRVLPVNTWARSFDEPIIVRIDSPEPAVVEVVRDDGQAFAELRVAAGSGEYAIDEAGAFLTPGRLHRLRFIVDGRTVAEVPALYDPSMPVSRLEFRDAATGDLVALTWHAVDLDRGLAARGWGSAAHAPRRDRVLFEAYGVDPKTKLKYYYASLPVPAGSTLLLEKRAYHYLRVGVAVDLGRLPLPPRLSTLAARLLEGSAEALARVSPLAFTSAVLRLLGLELPVLDARVSVTGGSVALVATVRQDLSPLAMMVLAALVGGVLAAAAALVIVEVAGGAAVRVDAGEYVRQKNAMYTELARACERIAQSPQEYAECLRASAEFVEVANTSESAFLETAVDAAARAEEAASRWKLLAAGAGGAALAAILARGRG